MGLARVSESCSETSNLQVDTNTPCVADLKKLTVPNIILEKLVGERHACQRSHSTSGVVCRPILNRAERDGCSGRCISLSPANSFRDRQMSGRLRVAFTTNEPPTNKTITSSNYPFGFPRSAGNDIVCKLDGIDSHSRMGVEVFERPSPDHDMGSSPRGKFGESFFIVSKKIFSFIKFEFHVTFPHFSPEDLVSFMLPARSSLEFISIQTGSYINLSAFISPNIFKLIYLF